MIARKKLKFQFVIVGFWSLFQYFSEIGEMQTFNSEWIFQILEKINYYTKICEYLRQIKKTV